MYFNLKKSISRNAEKIVVCEICRACPQKRQHSLADEKTQRGNAVRGLFTLISPVLEQYEQILSLRNATPAAQGQTLLLAASS